MKYLQLGGQMWTQSFANPLLAQKQQTKTTQTSGSEDGLLSESLLKDLRGHGIPVDYDAFMDQVSKLDQRMAAGLPVSSKAVRDLEAQANRVIQQNDYLKKAEELADKNDARGEIAVGGRGQLYTLQENGKIKTVSIADYDAEKDGPAMTVNELIEHRKFNPTQKFDTALTQVIGNSIGMQKINDYIMGIIQKVGSAETTEEAYMDLASYIGREAAKKPSQQELQNLQNLYAAMSELGPDALFKSKEVRESKNLQEAFNYIQSILPRDMQTQLRGRYVASGGNLDDSGAYIQSIIASSLGAANKTRNESYIDYEASLNKAAGKGNDMDQKRNLKSIETLIQGSLNKIDYHLTSSKNPSLGMVLHGNVIGALTNFDNNIVPKAPMSTAIQSSIGPLIDKNHMTMGSQKINESMLDTIVYDGNDVINVWAPVDSNGDIDLGGMQQFNELLEHFDSDPSLTIQDKNAILKEYGIDGSLDEQGNFHGGGNMAQFLVLTGLTSDEVINKDDPFADVLDSDQKNYEFDQINRIYGQINSKIKGKDGNLKFKKGWFNWSTDLVKAPIFMKLRPTAQTEVGTFANHGPLVKTQTYQTQLAQDQMRYNRQHSAPIQKPSTSLIYQ